MKPRNSHYFYAYIPLLISLAFSGNIMLNTFSETAEVSGSEKASVLAKGIANSLWSVGYGATITIILVAILIIISNKNNKDET